MTLGTDTAPAATPTRLREIDELPAPPGLPFVGNLLQFDRARIHQQVERWVKEYGPYFRFQLGNRRILAVADHATLGTLLRDRPDGFRRTKKLAEISAEIGSAVGVFGAEGQTGDGVDGVAHQVGLKVDRRAGVRGPAPAPGQALADGHERREVSPQMARIESRHDHPALPLPRLAFGAEHADR